MNRIQAIRKELAEFEQDTAAIERHGGKVPAAATAAIQRGANLMEELEVALAAEGSCF